MSRKPRRHNVVDVWEGPSFDDLVERSRHWLNSYQPQNRIFAILWLVIVMWTLVSGFWLLFGGLAMAANAEAPMCDVFLTRLRDAGRALTFPLPAVKIERNPYIRDYDAYWISYNYAGDVEWEGSLSCYKGRVVDYEIFFDDYDLRSAAPPFSLKNLRAWHMVSAAMYAFTGWQARQAVNAASDLLAKQPHTLTSPAPWLPLWGDTEILVGYAHLIIDTNQSLPPTPNSDNSSGRQSPPPNSDNSPGSGP